MPRSFLIKKAGSTTNYSHCPLKKRPVHIIKDTETDDHLMDVVEPENLSTKPQDLSVRRSESPMSPPPLVISTTPSPPPPALLPTPPPQALHHPHPFYLKASGGVLEPLSLNTPVAPAEQMCWPPMSHHHHHQQARHHHIHQHPQHPHHHHQFFYHPTVAPAPIRRAPVTTLYPPPALSPYAPPRAASSSPPAHRLYTAAFAPPFPGEGHQELNLLSPSSSSASSTEILGVEDLSRPAKGGKAASGGGARYSCQSCSKSYASFSHLSKHRALHCPAAAAATSPVSDDDHANNNQQPNKSFSCKYCEKTYVSLGALKMHIRTHTLPCKCKLCGKAFSRPWLLQGHIRTHTGEKPFSCQHCRRAFADRSNLRAHLQTHSDVKKYSCQHCSKTFSRMSLLGKHIDGGCPGLSQHAVDSIIMQQQHQQQLQPVH